MEKMTRIQIPELAGARLSWGTTPEQRAAFDAEGIAFVDALGLDVLRGIHRKTLVVLEEDVSVEELEPAEIPGELVHSDAQPLPEAGEEAGNERTMTDEELIAQCGICTFGEIEEDVKEHIRSRPEYAEYGAIAMQVLSRDSKVMVIRTGKRMPDADLKRLEELWTTRKAELWPGAAWCFVLRPRGESQDGEPLAEATEEEVPPAEAEQAEQAAEPGVAPKKDKKTAKPAKRGPGRPKKNAGK